MTWLELESSSIIMDISNNLDHIKLFCVIYYVVSLLHLIKFSAFTHMWLSKVKPPECQSSALGLCVLSLLVMFSVHLSCWGLLKPLCCFVNEFS